jgi:hypothetical protein
MCRKIAMLAVAVSIFIITGGVVSEPTQAWAVTGEQKQPDPAPIKSGTKPNKKHIRYPYAEKLRGQARQAPKAPEPKGKYKDWSQVLKDATAQEGLIKIWRKQEDVYFELTKGQLDVPHLSILTLSQGIGSYAIFGGLPVDDVMFDFHRQEDHLQIRRLGALFRAPGDEPLEKAIDLTFSPSIIASIPIVSEKDNGQRILVEMNDFFLSDISGVGIAMNALFKQPVRLDPKASFYHAIKTYPTNVEIDTRLVYNPSQPERLFLPSVPDPRFVQVGVQHSIRRLPEDPMAPRIEDDRIGYFTTVHKDFRETGTGDFMVHYVNRWRLEKKDPNAKMSEPKKPILFYIDRTVPDEYVPYIKAGVEWWQKAFEAAGFMNAIIAKPAPTPEEDPEYDPEDARYNTIRWSVSDQPLYGAIGIFRTDPRSGEILDSDVLIEHSTIANFGQAYRYYAGPRDALMDVDPGLRDFWMTEKERAEDVTMADIPALRGDQHFCCEIDKLTAMNGNFLRLAMLGRGMLPPGGELPTDFVGEALTWLAAHEVGHALGLRHNFKSSTATPYGQLNDKTVIDQIGLTGSVMDYAAVNVSVDPKKQGYYFSPVLGAYDLWAITWGYGEVSGQTPEEQKAELEKIASQSWKNEYLYGTDEDTYPKHALDPRCNIFDLSDNPLEWAVGRMAICDNLLRSGQLEDRVVADGDNYVELRRAVEVIYLQKYLANTMAIKYIGGQYTARPHKGDPGDLLPLKPVSPDDQRKALDYIVKNTLSGDSWTISPYLLNKLMDDKQRDWENNPFEQDRRFDFPMSLWIGSVQNAILTHLMNPLLQQRVIEAQYKVEQPFKLSGLYTALTSAIWEAGPAPQGQYAGLQRNLQRIYLEKLIQQVVTPFAATPPDAIELSRLNLRRIRDTANAALQKPGLDDETNAHLMETIARIDRALDARRMTMF